MLSPTTMPPAISSQHAHIRDSLLEKQGISWWRIFWIIIDCGHISARFLMSASIGYHPDSSTTESGFPQMCSKCPSTRDDRTAITIERGEASDAKSDAWQDPMVTSP